jgi:hypothetical protein
MDGKAIHETPHSFTYLDAVSQCNTFCSKSEGLGFLQKSFQASHHFFPAIALMLVCLPMNEH